MYDAPDHPTRLKAVQAWAELGLGKVRERPVEEEPVELLEKPIAQLSKQERTALVRHLVARYPEIANKIRREAAEALGVEPAPPIFVMPPRRRRP